jgi:hypothetical protein
VLEAAERLHSCTPFLLPSVFEKKWKRNLMVEDVLPPATEGFREFAARLGCQPGYVTDLRKSGRLVLTEDGRRVRVAESLRLIADTRDPTKTGVAARHALQRETSPAAVEEAAAPVAPEGEVERVDYSDPLALRRARAQAEREEALARKALRDEQLELGELLRRDDTVAALSDAVVQLRRRLELLPTTLAPQLAAVDDESRCAAMLRDGIEQALNELSRKFASAGKSA